MKLNAMPLLISLRLLTYQLASLDVEGVFSYVNLYHYAGMFKFKRDSLRQQINILTSRAPLLSLDPVFLFVIPDEYKHWIRRGIKIFANTHRNSPRRYTKLIRTWTK